MQMKALYMDDNYLKEFEAVVESIKDGKYVVLSQTAFYPSSGGQPNDAGAMVRESDKTEFKVVFVGKFDGAISHEVQNPEGAELKKGDRVKCTIDWDRRYKFMRSHTACHVLSAIFHNESGALITGNQIDLEKCRIDFSLENFDREKISEYISKANEALKRNLQIEISSMPREEALKIPSIVKLANALPPAVKELRIVKIGDIDMQADGGTHVRNTSEVGQIELVSAENKGKNNRKVYFRLI